EMVFNGMFLVRQDSLIERMITWRKELLPHRKPPSMLVDQVRPALSHILSPWSKAPEYADARETETILLTLQPQNPGSICSQCQAIVPSGVCEDQGTLGLVPGLDFGEVPFPVQELAEDLMSVD